MNDTAITARLVACKSRFRFEDDERSSPAPDQGEGRRESYNPAADDCDVVARDQRAATPDPWTGRPPRLAQYHRLASAGVPTDCRFPSRRACPEAERRTRATTLTVTQRRLRPVVL